MPQLAIYSLSDTTYTGPNPWAPGANANPSSPGNTSFTFNVGATFVVVDVTDDDTNLDDYNGDPSFNDGDATQFLTNPAVINETLYPAGQVLENEYSYIIRPAGSTDPADDITIHVLDEGGATPSIGFVSSREMIEGQTYDIIAIGTNNPSTPYSEIFVCFTEGAWIKTLDGERRVEELRPDDLVMTLDHGPQPVLWIGSRTVDLMSHRKQVPVLLRKDALGPELPNRDLALSPQHRVLVSSRRNDHVTDGEEVLAPARGFLKRRGVRRMFGRKRVTYYTIMTPRHEVLIANGLPVESFYPAPYCLSLLTSKERALVSALNPSLVHVAARGQEGLARRELTKRETHRLRRKRSLIEGRRFKGWDLLRHA